MLKLAVLQLLHTLLPCGLSGEKENVDMGAQPLAPSVRSWCTTLAAPGFHYKSLKHS